MAQFFERLKAQADFFTKRGTDNSSTGTLADVVNDGTSYLRFTGVSAVTLNSLVAAGSGKELTITNATGVDMVIANETGATAANRILTGTGGSISLSNNASLLLKYDDGASRWRVVGGVAGGFNTSATQTISMDGAAVLGSSFFQIIPVVGDSGPAVMNAILFGPTAPTNGTTIMLLGTDSDQFVYVLDGGGTAKSALLNGDCMLGEGSTLTLVYNSSLDRYVETARNDAPGE